MNILAVNWQDPANPQAGGAEIHLFEILERLAGRGHSVTVLCSGFEGASARADVRGVSIHRVGSRYTFPIHARSYFSANLAANSFDVILDDMNKVPLCTPLWGSGAPVVALVPHLFGTTAFAELPSPVAAIVWLSERPVPWIYRKSLFHVISQSTADDLTARGIPRRRITVIYPGIDTSHFTPRPEHRSHTPLLAYLGRLKRYKGVDLIIKAFARVQHPDARLHIAGSGDYREALEKLVQSLGITERVSFLGFVSESDKLALLRSAWATVFTSPKEGWGITNLESQACGTPVIASDSPGIRESVVDGESGILVPHGDVARLAEVMTTLAYSPAMVAAMGLRGRDFAESFSWERTATQTADHLQLAIQQWQ